MDIARFAPNRRHRLAARRAARIDRSRAGPHQRQQQRHRWRVPAPRLGGREVDCAEGHVLAVAAGRTPSDKVVKLARAG